MVIDKRGSSSATDYDSVARPPLSVDDIVELDNVPAKAAVPRKVAESLATHNLYLSGADNVAAQVEQSVQAHSKSHEPLHLSITAPAFLGRAGKLGERVAPGSLKSTATTAERGDAFQPEWAARVYHPKLGARPSERIMRGVRGRVIPVDNQEFVYPPENRAVFYPSGYPWQCIGKVEVYPSANADNPTTWGSGVLIGDRLVLTAGHVPPVNPPSGQWKMRFSAGLYNGSPVSGPGAVSYVSDFRGYLGGVSGIDYAVLRLYEPIGSALGYFGWKTYDGSWNNGNYWWLAGYPYDIAGANSPSYQSGIAVLDDPANQGGLELEHHGDVASGDSGGPFWGFWNDAPYVVGTTSGHLSTPDDNVCAGGNALSELLGWARTNWPK